MSDLEKQTWTPGPEEGEADEILKTIVQWRRWAYTWSGSAFVGDDEVENEAEHRSQLYSDLCLLGTHMTWMHDEVVKLRSERASSPNMVAALREAERFMEYFAGETDNTFHGSGTPQTCLAMIRSVLSRVARAKAQVTPEQKS
jgi:hypothetical protein